MPVISEVAWGGTSASASDEWIEIYNPGETAVELAGWRLSGLDGTPDIMLQGSLAPGAYFLLERTDDTTISDVVADQIYSGALGNTDEGLALWDASGTLVDTANGDGGDWPAGSASPEHQSMERTGLTESDSDVNWHSNQGSIRNGLDAGGNPIQGTPRQPNSPPTQLEPTPTPEPTYSPTSEPTSQPTPYPANISLNEFMPDPATDWNQDGSVNTNDEYVELFNANDVPVDLSGWLLDDVDDYLAKSGMPQGSQPYHLPDGTYIPPRGFLLLFRGQTGIALNNDDDWVRLLHPDGSLVEATQYDSSHDDQAYSKTEDGGFQWTQSFPPSPGTSNQPPPTPTPTPTPTTGTLGGFVFEDVDGDGRYEPWAGEPGISGVLVTLSNGFSRLTGDSGFYGWRNLPAGQYTVRQAQPVHSNSTTPDELTITLDAGQERIDLHFGELYLAADQIWSPLVLNEFLPSPASDWNGDGDPNAQDEWIELYNRSDSSIDLGGWFLDDVDDGLGANRLADPTGSKPYLIPAGTVVPANGYAVIYRSASSVALNNGGDTVRLLGPGRYSLEAFSFGATGTDVAWAKRIDGGTEWTQAFPPSPGASNQPPPTAPSTPTPSATPAGTPTATPTAYPDGISLNEFLPNPASDWNQDGTTDTDDEYVELFNAGDRPVDVGGWWLDDVDDGELPQVGNVRPGSEPDGSRPYRIPDGTTIPPYNFLLLFRSQTGIALNNDGDWVRLIRPDGLVVEQVQYDASRRDEAQSKVVDGGHDWTGSYPPSPGRSNAPDGTPTATPTATPTPSPTPSGTPTAPIDGSASLNEFMPRPATDWNGDGEIDPADEYVELYNGGNQPVHLGGWMLDDVDDGIGPGKDSAPGGSRPYRLPDDTVLPAHGFLVLFRNQTGIALNDSGGDSVRLLRPDGSEVERHEYLDAAVDGAYSKLQDGGNIWTTDYPASPGAPNRPAYTADDIIRLNEVLASPRDVDWDGSGQADYQDEWIELFNGGQTTVELRGWKLSDGAPPAGAGLRGTSGRTYELPADTVLAPGHYLVIHRRQSGLALDPSDEWLRLLFPDDHQADALHMDRFSGYDQSWCRLPDGTGGWTTACQETPGAANEAGSGGGGKPGAGKGEEGGSDSGPPYDRFNHDLYPVIHVRSLPDGTRATIEGQITALPGVFGSRQAYIQDATGGILVYLRSAEWPPLSEGQWVRVNGRLDTYHGEREVRLTRIDDVKTLGQGSPPSPLVIRSGQVDQITEGQLVMLSAPVRGFRGRTTLYLDDGSGRAQVVIRESTGLRRPYVILGDVWTVIGVVSQWDDDPPYDEGYRILPRQASDLQRGQIAPAAARRSTTLSPAMTGEASTPQATGQAAWTTESAPPPLYLPVTGEDYTSPAPDSWWQRQPR